MLQQKIEELRESSSLMINFKLNLPANWGYLSWGVPIKRTLVNWVQYWGPLILGNYQIAEGLS